MANEALKRAKKWLYDCSAYHTACAHVSRMSRFPTRILDIGPPGTKTIRLCQLNAEGHYAALSHCWGTAQDFTTTSKTLEARKQGIVVDHLPQTFQDAIVLTRSFDIRYLWIDSLCIIQDDVQDWQQESARMASVYSAAYLTIVASNASGDSEGFLRLRPEGDIVAIPYQASQGSNEMISSGSYKCFPKRWVPSVDNQLYLQLASTHRSCRTVKDHLQTEPLSQRAWAMQERYLSTRALFIGKKQMFWECQVTALSETGDRLDIYNPLRQVDRTTGPNAWGTKAWSELVAEYSTRALTKPSDKLPAFSGLASAFPRPLTPPSCQPRDNKKYLAGIWKDSLLEGLLWSRAGEKISIPSEYRAPSFSWASIDGAVKFLIDDLQLDKSGKYFHPLAYSYGFEMEHEGPGLYGQVKWGKLLMGAPKHEIKLLVKYPLTIDEVSSVKSFSFEVQATKKFESTLSNLHSTTSLIMDGHFDGRAKGKMHSPLFAIFLARTPVGPDRHSWMSYGASYGAPHVLDLDKKYHGLLVSPADTGSEDFIRVGMFSGLARIQDESKLEEYLYAFPNLLHIHWTVLT